jgi:hypothetical protein
MYALRRSAPLALQGSAAPQVAVVFQKVAGVHTSANFAEGMKKESISGPATPADELNSEKQVKYGVNTPRNVGEFASEASHAAGGIIDSVKDTINVTATAIKRTLGMTNEKPLSTPEIHGGAGKMQHAPPEVGKDLPEGGPAKSRAHAESKYQEIMDTEKPHFPHGEQSVNEMYPDMREAAKLQNRGGGGEKEKVGANLGVKGGEGKENRGMENESQKQQMDKTLHDLGP